MYTVMNQSDLRIFHQLVIVIVYFRGLQCAQQQSTSGTTVIKLSFLILMVQ